MKKGLIGFMGLSKGMGLAALLILALTLVWTVNAMSAEDFEHEASFAPSPVSEGNGDGQESTSEFRGDPGTTPEQSPIIKRLHQARERGDDATMREIEAILRPAPVKGEDKESAITPSTSFGGAGDPTGKNDVPDQVEATFGTDVKVRPIDPDGYEFNHSVASDSSGNLYVAWQDDATAPYDYIQIYWSSDDGQTWSAYGYVQNASAALSQPSIAIGEGVQDRLLLAYIIDDGTNIPHPEVAYFSTLGGVGGTTPTIVSLTYWTGRYSYSSPVIWTDSFDWPGWFVYLTAETDLDGPSGDFNVDF